MVEMEGHETVEKRRINLAPALPKRGQSPSRRRRRTVSGRDVARREDENVAGGPGLMDILTYTPDYLPRSSRPAP